MIDSLASRGAPLHAERWGNSTKLLSYEAYAAENPNHRFIERPGPEASARVDTLTEAEARARFTTMQETRIAEVKYATGRDLLRDSILLAFALALFVSHWRWLRKHSGAPADGAP